MTSSSSRALPLLAFLSYFSLALAAPAAPELEIEGCRYLDQPAAEQAWQPMNGSLPVCLAMQEGRKVLRFTCNFEGTTIQRASWDRRVNLDLASAEGIQLQVLCRDASPVSYFSIFFQSGEGWYHSAYFPESDKGWNTISLRKAEMSVEGKPAGWSHITAIRLSAWRAKSQNTEFFVASISKAGMLGADASVAVLRSQSAARQSEGEKRTVEQTTEVLTDWLNEWGVHCATLNDTELAPGSLGKAKLVVLPYNPTLPEAAVAELRRYCGGGGKVLAFYTVSEAVAALLNFGPGTHVRPAHPGQFASIRPESNELPGAPTITAQDSWNINSLQPLPGKSRVVAQWFDNSGKASGYPAVLASTNGIVMTHVLLPQDATNKKRLLLAMTGRLVPELWKQAADQTIQRIGAISDFENYGEALRQLSLSSTNARVRTAVESAERLRTAALRLTEEKQYSEAIAKATEAKEQLERAYCLAQKPVPGEFRAFWCHSAFGVQGISWDEAASRLASNGFTAIFPNMLWGGTAFYNSKVLPVNPQVAQRGDQIQQCLTACRKHGLQTHVWKVNWNLDQSAPEAFVHELRKAGRLQASPSGAELRWLCPSHPKNANLEVDSMVEIARNYPVDGLHFDYIRYPDGDHCFCPGCKERFQARIGRRQENWPKDVLEGGTLRQQWLDWRRDNITDVVRRVSDAARRVRPTIKISAAVFNNWAQDRDSVGQDWKLWCEKGYVDFVCPMNYTPSNRNFENMISRQKVWAGRTPLYPGIGFSASMSSFGVDRAIDQIDISRRQQTGGFVIFNYGVRESRELLPLLGLGITARQ